MNTHYDAAYFEWQNEAAEIAAQEGLRYLAAFIQKGDSVVDFGCGAGHYLKRMDAAQKTGVEINPAARAAASAAGLQVLPHADALPDAAADVVISIHALEHCRNPLQELETLRAKLKPGGRAVFLVPSEGRKRYRAGDVNQHLFAWNAMTLGNLFAAAGFEVIAVQPIRNRLPPKTALLHRLLPAALFHLACVCCGLLSREGQLGIVARREV